KDRLNDGKRRHGRRVRPQNPRSERNWRYEPLRPEQGTLLLCKASLRTDQNGKRPLSDLGKGAQRILARLALVAEQQMAIQIRRQPVLEYGPQRNRLGNRRHGKDAALLAGFDDIGFHALKVEAGDLCVLRKHGTERADTHLHCFLRSEEHTSELQSRENLVCRLLLEKKN